MPENKRNRIVFGARPWADLLPKRERAELVHERTMPKLLLALVASAVIAGLTWFASTYPVQLANDRLAAAEEESLLLATQLSEFGGVQITQANVNQLQQQQAALGAGDTLYVELLYNIERTLPEGALMLGFAAQPAIDIQQVAEAGERPIDGFPNANEALASQVCTGGDTELVLSIALDSPAVASQALSAFQRLEGFVCAELVKGESDSQFSSIFKLVLDESVRSNRYVEGAEQ